MFFLAVDYVMYFLSTFVTNPGSIAHPGSVQSKMRAASSSLLRLMLFRPVGQQKPEHFCQAIVVRKCKTWSPII